MVVINKAHPDSQVRVGINKVHLDSQVRVGIITKITFGKQRALLDKI